MLQGSLENFALDEVLGLLSGTSKTGQLEIAGNRGTGSLMFHEGRLVNGSASFTANGTELEDIMFELLRYDDGTFTFTHREVSPDDVIENVSTVLANAEARLQDWRAIEAVVPSLNHQVVPVLELPSDEVTVSRDEWATLMTVGTGCPASHVCDRLSLGEVEGSRRIKDLAERMLVNVTEPVGSYRRSRPAAETGRAAAPAAAGTAPAATAGAGATAGAAATIASTGAQPAAAAAVSEPASSLEALAGGAPSTPAAPAATPAAATTTVPPGPPSPSEIAGFGEQVEDASELLDGGDDARGGLLARYLRNEE
ncbi:MAG: DUF4388 domain-containing protein [Actinomycetota bacterium]